MREVIEPLVQRFVRASAVPPKQGEVARTLKDLHQIPEETTMAVLDELDREGLINRHDGRIWKVKKKRNFFNWLTRLLQRVFKISDTRRNEI